MSASQEEQPNGRIEIGLIADMAGIFGGLSVAELAPGFIPKAIGVVVMAASGIDLLRRSSHDKETPLDNRGGV